MQRSSLNTSILALAVPAIVANITTPLLSLVDLAIVGHLGSPVYVGAIAVSGTVFNMLYWVFGFLRFGTSGLTAQAYGERNHQAMHLSGLRSLLIAAVLGVVLVLLQFPLSQMAFWIMNPDATTRAVPQAYFNIVIYGAPAVLIQYSLTGWFVGMQNTRVPMLVSLFINIVNIGVSLLLVYGFEMGIQGVAAGTLAAQWAGCLLALAIARLRPAAWRDICNTAALSRFFSINADIFLRTLCLICVTVWFTRTGAAQGAVILAVNALLMQLFTLFSYFMDGFAFAAEAMCGKLYGATDYSGLRQCVRRFVLWGIVMALIFTLLYGVFDADIVAVLTDDLAIRNASGEYHLWAVLVPAFGFLAFIADGIAIGLTQTRKMLQSMVLSTALFFALYHLLAPQFENHALWVAFLSYLLGRGLLLFSMLRRTIVGQR